MHGMPVSCPLQLVLSSIGLASKAAAFLWYSVALPVVWKQFAMVLSKPEGGVL